MIDEEILDDDIEDILIKKQSLAQRIDDTGVSVIWFVTEKSQ